MTSGRFKPELAELAPKGERRMSANPHANGGLLLRDLRLPDFREYAVEVTAARRARRRGHARHGQVSARCDEAEHGAAKTSACSARRKQLQPLAGRARSDQSRLDGGDVSLRRPSRARRPRDGNVERASMPGLARRLSAHRPARLLLLLRGVHSHHRFDVQPARQMAEGLQSHSLAAAHRVAELPAVVACLAAGPQRLQPSGSRASSITS